MELIRGRELAQKILDQITAHPETHDQGSWVDVCGTTYCIAGWAVALNALPGDNETLQAGRRAMARELNTVTDWEALGRKLLGLDEDAADALFFSDTQEAPVLLAELFDLEYAAPESGE